MIVVFRKHLDREQIFREKIVQKHITMKNRCFQKLCDGSSCCSKIAVIIANGHIVAFALLITAFLF